MKGNVLESQKREGGGKSGKEIVLQEDNVVGQIGQEKRERR